MLQMEPFSLPTHTMYIIKTSTKERVAGAVSVSLTRKYTEFIHRSQDVEIGMWHVEYNLFMFAPNYAHLAQVVFYV